MSGCPQESLISKSGACRMYTSSESSPLGNAVKPYLVTTLYPLAAVMVSRSH